MTASFAFHSAAAVIFSQAHSWSGASFLVPWLQQEETSQDSESPENEQQQAGLAMQTAKTTAKQRCKSSFIHYQDAM
jgi:hypothetical protein